MPELLAPDVTLPESSAALPSSGRRAKLPPEALQAAIAAAGGTAAPEPKPEPARAPEPIAATPKAAPEPAPKPQPTAAPQPKPEPRATETPKPAEVPKPAEAPKKKEAIAEVREAYERASAKVKELETNFTATNQEKAEAYAKAAKAEEEYAKLNKKITEEYEPIRQRYGEMEKRLQEREELIRVHNYTASEDWHKNHERPLAEAKADALAFLSEFEVQMADGSTRRASEKELDALLAAPSANQALAVAKQIFGDDVAPLVLNHRMKIQSLVRSRHEALGRANLESLEYQKRQQAAMADHKANFQRALMAKAEEMVAPLKPADTEPDLVEAFNEGTRFADGVLQTDPSSLPPQQLVDRLADTRKRLIRDSVNVRMVDRLKSENESLRNRLSEYEKSEPKVEPRNGGTHIEPADSKERIKQKLMEEAVKAATRR